MAGDLRRYAATNARVRTLLSTLLGRNGLEMLCGYPSAEAIVEALVRTPYGVTAGDGATTDRSLLARLAEVGRLVVDLLDEPEQTFVREYLRHHEVASLKVLIRAVAQHLSSEALTAYLVAAPGIGTVATHELASVRDLRELVERLDHTSYGAALHAALHRVDSAGPFALEVALEIDYYERLWSAAAALRRPDADRAHHLLGILFDILNLGWISRYHSIALSAEEILNYTLRQGRWVTLDVRRALAEDRDTPWNAALARTPYAALLGEAPPHHFDAASVGLWRFLAGEIQRTLTGYPFHIGVPLGFLLAQEIEIRDLRVLLAAKSIGVPSAEIIEHLATVRH
jgi:vacuolar-type H+-ATPase subunit C/Vma6